MNNANNKENSVLFTLFGKREARKTCCCCQEDCKKAHITYFIAAFWSNQSFSFLILNWQRITSPLTSVSSSYHSHYSLLKISSQDVSNEDVSGQNLSQPDKCLTSTAVTDPTEFEWTGNGPEKDLDLSLTILNQYFLLLLEKLRQKHAAVLPKCLQKDSYYKYYITRTSGRSRAHRPSV